MNSFKQTIQSRQSNIELLRLIIMFIIIVHHCIAHGPGIEIESAHIKDGLGARLP